MGLARRGGGCLFPGILGEVEKGAPVRRKQAAVGLEWPPRCFGRGRSQTPVLAPLESRDGVPDTEFRQDVVASCEQVSKHSRPTRSLNPLNSFPSHAFMNGPY